MPRPTIHDARPQPAAASPSVAGPSLRSRRPADHARRVAASQWNARPLAARAWPVRPPTGRRYPPAAASPVAGPAHAPRGAISGAAILMLARVMTFAVDGVEARRVWVEADIRQGLPAFTVVGLADKAVREARERVRAALVNSGYEFPLRRITVNLAPAYLRKVGPAFDLPLAVALLVASWQLEPGVVEGTAVVGELSLTGEVRPVRGALAVAEGVRRTSCSRLVLPLGRAREASLVPDIEVVGVESLPSSSRLLRGDAEPRPVPDEVRDVGEVVADFADVRGHNGLVPGLEVAAAGGHNLFLQGPPGTGKTMIARRLPSILPPLSPEEAIEVTRIQSVAGVRGGAGLVTTRPFRAPHHTISAAGLVGGANPPQPGEATLAHRGVLFLDELSEFSRPSLESLRQPLEDGHVTIVRGQQTMVFPTRFMLVAASNPCPCGHGGTRCTCSQIEIARYRRRLSGPLLDRIDILMRVERAPAESLTRQAAPASAGPRARRGRTRAPGASPRRAPGGLQRAAHLAPDPGARADHAERNAAARRALRPPLALGARPHAHPARGTHASPTWTARTSSAPEHISVAASLRFDDAVQLAEAREP